jgi:hypothetical protein
VERRDLVADRLPPTGRHEDKIVSAPDQSFYDLFLERAESIEAEDGFEGLAGRPSLCCRRSYLRYLTISAGSL